MFTGIVQGLVPVTRLVDETRLRRIVLELEGLSDNLELGASVAVNGTCLTVTAVQGSSVSFDVIQETLSLTNLGALVAGDLVNVERSFRVGDEIGGHILSGHVSGMVVLTGLDQSANLRNLRFSAPPELMKCLLHKGFVALDGASLTIASVDAARNEFDVCLIPETIGRTTLGRIELGARVNLEVDAQTQAIVETVERLLSTPEWRDRLATRT